MQFQPATEDQVRTAVNQIVEFGATPMNESGRVSSDQVRACISRTTGLKIAGESVTEILTALYPKDKLCKGYYDTWPVEG